jgi:putative nucleotidyltransferase with HDIG domain
MEMLDHIVAHSVRVCQVATLLAEQLVKVNVSLNGKLVQAAAMLHDITKTRSIQTGEMHASTGACVLQDLGYPEVAGIIEQHVILDSYSFAAPPTEAEIVNYADKRVLHDRVVPLQDRLEYILERYGKDEERRQKIRFMWQKTEKLESKLFSRLPIRPKTLVEMAWGEDEIFDFFTFRDSLSKKR